jgi:hypothetical protein
MKSLSESSLFLHRSALTYSVTHAIFQLGGWARPVPTGLRTPGLLRLTRDLVRISLKEEVSYSAFGVYPYSISHASGSLSLLAIVLNPVSTGAADVAWSFADWALSS